MTITMTRGDLLAKAGTLFPGDQNAGLRKEIETSLDVPQYGPYHKEGIWLWTHFALIFATLADVAKGVFHTSIPPAVQAMLARAVVAYQSSLEAYVLLHDLDKATCLTLKFTSGEDRAVTWAEWQELILSTPVEWRDAISQDDWMTRVCQHLGIEQISYFQKLGKGESRAHGKVAADRLRTMGIDEAICRAIETHEVAYSFDKVNIPTYLKYFGEMSESDRDFALLASYADTMATIRENGEPDMTNFVCLAKSRLAAEAFVELDTRLKATPNLVPHLLTGELDQVRKSPMAFESEEVDAAFARIVKAATPASFDSAKVQAALGAFPELSADDVAAIIANPGDAGKLVGKKMGKRMGELKSALAACQL